MNHARLLTSPEELEEMLSGLRSQGILPPTLHLVGLLGVGNDATVFEVTIIGVPHILKVFDSASRMRQELRQLSAITPRGRQFLSWEHQDPAGFSFFVAEMVPGHTFRSGDITDSRTAALAEQLVGVYRLHYRQPVSILGLRRRLVQSTAARDQIKTLGLDPASFEQLYRNLRTYLDSHAADFRVRKSRIHGDLWWPNIVASDSGAHLIDWGSVSRADPAEDLAKLRLGLWFPRNSFPSRNFFWSGSNHRQRVSDLMRRIVTTYDREFDDGLPARLRFYLPLHGLNELATLAVGGSTVEPVLRPSLYRLLATDILNLAADPLAPPPDLRGTEYYQIIQLSRRERLDGLPGPAD